MQILAELRAGLSLFGLRDFSSSPSAVFTLICKIGKLVSANDRLSSVPLEDLRHPC